MFTRRPFQSSSASRGFTLLELLLALTIFALVAALSGSVFFTVTKAWSRGGEMLDMLHYGDFAMEQLVGALRGAAWFPSKPEAFGFWLDDSGGTGRDAENVVSWVTSGSAFLPPDSDLFNGLYRLSVTVDSVDGNRGLVVRTWPHLTEEEDGTGIDPRLLVPNVRGFSCEWYDFEEEDWSQEWEHTNSLPKLLRITLTMEKRENFDEYLELQRLVELEVAPDLPGRERRSRGAATGDRRGTTTDEGSDAGGGGTGPGGVPDRSTTTPGSSRPTVGGGTTTRTPTRSGNTGLQRPTIVLDGNRGGSR